MGISDYRDHIHMMPVSSPCSDMHLLLFLSVVLSVLLKFSSSQPLFGMEKQFLYSFQDPDDIQIYEVVEHHYSNIVYPGSATSEASAIVEFDWSE